MRFTTLALAAAGAAAVSAIDTVKISGRHWVTSSGKPFFIKGVDYQPGGASLVGSDKDWDPLADPEKCARDIILFQKLGVNTIRVYSIDPALDHDECMTMLAAAGIYLVLDVNSPIYGQHLHSTEPWTTYTPAYLEHIFTVMEIFSGYENTLAFLSGNEVIHDPGSEKTAPQYIKAVTRDMKAYSKKHLKRQIPVGYSNADHLEFRNSLSDFLACGEEGASDFFGLNSYQWCGDNTFEGSGFDKLVEDFENYPLPIFFSEYGCNEVRPRLWQEVTALYSDDMTHVFSGGLIYEFSQEKNDYGLVEIKANGDAQVNAEFEALEEVFSEIPEEIQIPAKTKKVTRPTTCKPTKEYKYITANNTLPATLGASLIENGVDSKKFKTGSILDVKAVKTTTKYKLLNSQGGALNDAVIDTDGAENPKKDDKNGAGALSIAFGFTTLAALAASFILL